MPVTVPSRAVGPSTMRAGRWIPSPLVDLVSGPFRPVATHAGMGHRDKAHIENTPDHIGRGC